MSASRLLILTGPPGAGKTTIARRLAEQAPSPGGVHLHGDDFLAYVRAGFIEPWKAEAAEQNRTLTRALAGAAVAFAAGGYLTVLDWIVGPWFLDEWKAAARGRRVALDYVVLRPSLETARLRAGARATAPVADYAPLAPLHEQLSDLGELESHVIDTTGLTPDETVAAVQAGLAGGAFRLG